MAISYIYVIDNFFFGVYTVTSVTVNSGGSGYQTSPSLAFSPGGATATANISGGAVTSVTVTSGGFYTSTPPTVTPTGGGAIVYATKVYKAYKVYKLWARREGYL